MSEREPLRITRRTAIKWGALAAAAPALSLLPLDAFASGDSVVLLWNEAALQGARDSKLGPPMVARALAVVHTCIFDAWAAYDHRAVGTRLGGALRRPPRERTLANMNTAISFASYRAAVDLFPGDRAGVFDPLMSRLRDDATQLGDKPGGKPGVAYADYTGYTSANDPMDLRPGAKFDPATIHDPDRWQPLRYVDATGAVVTQPFIGAQWQHVTPFALTNVAQLRSPTGPAGHGIPAYESQARALLAISAGLTDEQKMIAEYWADGPRSELPAGPWDPFPPLCPPPRPSWCAQARGCRRRQTLLCADERGLRRERLLLGQQAILRIGPTDHRHPVSLPRAAGPRLGWAVSGHPTDRRRRLVALSGLNLPNTAVPGVQLRSQHLQCGRGRDPEALHRKRRLRSLGPVSTRQLEVRGRSGAWPQRDASLGNLQRGRPPGPPLPALWWDPLSEG